MFSTIDFMKLKYFKMRNIQNSLNSLNIRFMPNLAKYADYCPKCRNERQRKNLRKKPLTVFMDKFPQLVTVLCHNCGYKDVFFEETTKKTPSLVDILARVNQRTPTKKPAQDKSIKQDKTIFYPISEFNQTEFNQKDNFSQYLIKTVGYAPAMDALKKFDVRSDKNKTIFWYKHRNGTPNKMKIIQYDQNGKRSHNIAPYYAPANVELCTLFGEHLISQHTTKIIFVESEKNAFAGYYLTLLDVNLSFAVFVACGGSERYGICAQFVRNNPQYQYAVLFDCDNAGRNGAQRLIEATNGTVKNIDLDADKNDGFDLFDYFLNNINEYKTELNHLYRFEYTEQERRTAQEDKLKLNFDFIDFFNPIYQIK